MTAFRTETPEPLVAVDTDIRDLDGFMLNTERLLASELWATSTGEEFKAAVALWCRAWKQTPPGSLPDDDRVLASFSGAGKRWPKVRDTALHGFVKCSDGRLYHQVLCEDVVRAARKKKERHERTLAATEARKKHRDDDRHVDRDDQRNVNRDVDVTLSHRQDRDRDRDKEREEAPSLRSGRTRAKARSPLPDCWQPDEQDVSYARERGFATAQIHTMASAFVNHHRAKGSLMADWHAAWRTWCENEIKFQRSPQSRAPPLKLPSFQDVIRELTEPESSHEQPDFDLDIPANPRV